MKREHESSHAEQLNWPLATRVCFGAIEYRQVKQIVRERLKILWSDGERLLECLTYHNSFCGVFVFVAIAEESLFLFNIQHDDVFDIRETTFSEIEQEITANGCEHWNEAASRKLSQLFAETILWVFVAICD